jgi:hypothetical protein
MSSTRWRAALRRCLTVVAGAITLTIIGAGVALADVSPSQPTQTGPDTMYWSGQGAPVSQLCDTNADSGGVGFINGSGPNNYELWIFGMDHGAVSGTPTLTVNGTTYTSPILNGGEWHFVTPYIDPSTIIKGDGGSAYTSFVVSNTGTGSWGLKISHGCAGNAAKPLTISKSAAGDYTTTSHWKVEKSADPGQLKLAPGQQGTASYTVTVTNTSNDNGAVTVHGQVVIHNLNNGATDQNSTPTVTDHLSDGTQCTVDPLPASLPSGDTTLNYTCDPDSGFFNNGPPTNKAVLTWGNQTLSDGSQLAGDSANTGDVAITPLNQSKVNDCITPSDPKAPDGTFKQVCLGDLDANSQYKFTYSMPFTGGTDQNSANPPGTCTDNTNTVSLLDANGNVVDSATDSAHVNVCVGADLTVSKDANPTFKRTYAWDIHKAVDKTKVNQVGGSATFNYTVNASQTGVSDSEWAVKGTIHVANPNDWEGIDLTGLSDAVDNGGNCSLDSQLADPTTIPAGGSMDFPYTCTYSSAPSAASGTNTATATWDKYAAATPDGSASGQAGFAFNKPTSLVNQTVHVTDTLGGDLGTLTGTDSTPFASGSYQYAKAFPVPANGCQSYSNTATIKETNQSDSKTVTVCGPAKTGALTIGFWQNKNGQGYITGGASTAGVCNSGTWLRKELPFQDLSATATCSQVAAYFVNMFKAANASGASMNAMLKAQSLATALDVYFSDPTLGGNKISAPGPVGAVKIDLTQICKMIDGTGGTATCSGVYENAGPAFNGAASLNVQQMLDYAASQSNIGGSSWYGNAKATQQLAKDAFDAINNQVAFGA